MSTEPSPFKVALRVLPAHRRVVVTPTYVDELVRGLPLRDALEETPTDDGGIAELDLETADGQSVQVQGTFTGQVTVACSRCVAPAPIRFDDPVRVTFLPAAQVPAEDDPDGATAGKSGDDKPARTGKARRGAKAGAGADKPGDKAKKTDDEDDGLELATDDLDVFPYSGDVIDLEALVREQFVLSIPYAPLCKDDCLGLCPQCGTDRNVAPCDCEKPIDPRFVGLKGLKLPS